MMIRISQIDDKFSIYKENVVVLIGIGAGTKQIIELMQYHKIEINYICDNHKDSWGKIVEGIPIISPPHMEQIAKKENIVAQISVNNMAEGIEKQLFSIGIKNIVSYDECHNILNCTFKMNLFKNNKLTFDENEYSPEFRALALKEKFTEYVLGNYFNKQLILICMPGKTGDNTLMSTFSSNNIHWLVMDHAPQNFDLKLLNSLPGKVKIITALREPISQNLSLLYQMIAGFGRGCSGLGATPKAKTFYNLYPNDLFKDGGDAQTIFTQFYDNSKEGNISNFMNRFKNNLFDIFDYNFDKEKGYTIIENGNIEVFVFQLEKMNEKSTIKAMSDWISMKPFDAWVKGNEASGKWIADSYKQAQKEITFSQEYFDRCFNEPWIQHFYSQEDIEKFKERWRSHIKD